MEDNNLILQAREMHHAGKSIRNIASILGTSKSNVHRWIHNSNQNEPITKIKLSGDVPEETGQHGTYVPQGKQNINHSNYKAMDNKNYEDEKLNKEIMLKRLEMEQQLRLRKEDREDDEISIRREQLRLERLKLDQPHQIEKQEEKSLHWDLMRFFKRELEIIQDSDNYIEIIIEDLSEKVKLLQQLVERIEKHCFKYDLEAEELAYHSNAKQLYKYFYNLLKENEDLLSDNEQEDDSDDDLENECDPVYVQYRYDRTAIERIRMLTVAEFDMEVNEF